MDGDEDGKENSFINRGSVPAEPFLLRFTEQGTKIVGEWKLFIASETIETQWESYSALLFSIKQ